MPNDKYIQENKTKTFKKGDNVEMFNCLEAEKGVRWVCQTDSFKSIAGLEVVFLQGFSGYFYTKFLKKTDNLK